MSRSKSSKRWLQEHHQDSYVLKAREQGYRSRAVFKLEEIQRKDRVLKSGQFVLDLGAAPGGWSEYASHIVGDRGRVLALDLLPMDPVAGVEFLQGDFSDAEVFNQLLDLAGGRRFDLVLSDMAPSLSGIDSVDQPKSMYLAELALGMAREFLTADGAFVVKLFQGEGFEKLVSALRLSFKMVKLRKPEASRSRSREIYAVCVGLR
ncbi:MAG: 23S rRNA (uridine(2552)-2'-O)-methyltransferase RlmE [Gammaproteobacteria bacterium]|nr:23S rRNA (uridine(2552)-2'-O)-methyltransferase RlmE [Gammaproteobacteria bacterium]MDH3536672.1 23S rRNA (uridine(2552)-2'-O)-methyltransferase RlmE [Gammaproteobacteria bacterium]